MHGKERGTEFGYSLYEFEIYGSGARNIALGKPAYALHFKDSNKAPKYVVDGKRTGRRWESPWDGDWEDGGDKDPENTWDETEWISVDLGAVATITNVVLFWEDAYAVDFRIQVSIDGITWMTKYTGTNNLDPCETVNFITFSPPITGRYIRMLGCERRSFGDMKYGYSLYEFEVYGYGDDPTITPTPTPGPLSGYWDLVWSDEFDGDGLNEDNWTIETDVCVNNEQQSYTTSISNVRVVSAR